MFTGIVEAVGRRGALRGGRLEVLAPRDLAPEGFADGESVAVNGACLTVVAQAPEGDSWRIGFDLSEETLARTGLGELVDGSPLNLERAMRADGRFGGHVVQGHVDGTGVLLAVHEEPNSVVYRFQVPPEGRPYLIDKGSISLDGISLTVVNPVDTAEGAEFEVWVIPHTLAHTNLGSKRPGDRVNVEYDVVAKYVQRMNAARTTL